MTPRCEDVAAPSVESMLSNQKGEANFVGLSGIQRLDLSGQVGNILRVVEDWNPNTGLMRRDSFQSLEHFEVGDFKSAVGKEVLREERTPDAVRVQDRPDGLMPLG